jgi:hypothetical protein
MKPEHGIDFLSFVYKERLFLLFGDNTVKVFDLSKLEK